MKKQGQRTYEDVCRELADKGIDSYRATILTDLDSVELGRYYRLFFEFGQEFLDKEGLPFDIRPARMYFNTIPKAVNASARYLPDSGYHLIEVNRGSIKTLFRHFYFENKLFDDPALVPFRDLARSVEQEPGFIIFQATCLYLLYHEIGHLVQNSLEHGPVYEENLQGMPDRGSLQDRHIREMDADYFSGYHLAIHIKAFAESVEAKSGRLTTDGFEKCAALALSAVYMFHIMVSYHARGIYFQEKTHPHPAIRLPYIIGSFFGCLKSIADRPWDVGKVTSQAMLLASIIMKKKAHDPVQVFTRLVASNSSMIGQYRRDLHLGVANYRFASSQFLPIPSGDIL